MAPGLLPHNSTLVLVGHFTPPAYQPRWFADQKLIRSQEAGTAEIEIVHAAVVSFRARWLMVKVEEQRFQLGTEQEAMYDLLRDLAAGTFGRLQDSSPRAIGINWVYTYEPPSEDTAHALGHRLVQKDGWSDILINPGTVSVAIEGQRPDDYRGNLQVRTILTERNPYKILIEVNDHFDLTEDDSKYRLLKVGDILGSVWKTSRDRGQNIAEQIALWGEGR